MTNKEFIEYLENATGGIMSSRIYNMQKALRGNGILKSHSTEFTASDYAWFIYALFASPYSGYNKAIEWVAAQWDFWRTNYPEERTGYITPIDVLARLFSYPAEAKRVGRLMLEPYTGAITIQWDNGAIDVPANQKIYQAPPEGQRITETVFIAGEVVREIAAEVQATIKRNQEIEA